MLKAFKKDILLAMKQGQKFQKQTMGISLQYVIIVVKNITLKKSAFAKRKRHFCCRDCYSKYRAELLPKEEQHAYGTGYSQEERAKRKKAREIFNHYVRDKHIKKQPCEMCGNENVEAHHDDYNRPLEVRWLCFNCHRKWHKEHDNHELLEGGE